MLFKIVFSTLFYCVLSTTMYPNLFYIRTCVVLIHSENITFQNSFIQTEYEGDNIFFSACKDLAQVGCDKESFACIQNNEKEHIINFIDKLEEKDDFIRLKSKEGYQFDVELNRKIDKFNLSKKRTKNSYSLEINPDFKERCTKTIGNDRNLFFKDFYKKDIVFESNNVKVSLNLCGTSPLGCPNQDSSICSFDKTTNESLEWGKISRLNIENNDQGNLVFDYYKPRKRGGRFHSSITLKCNWTTLNGPKSFKRINSNTKMEVVLESYLGCSKKDMNCIITDPTDGHYLYDLTRLSRFNGWILNGYKKGNVKLNICGPLKSQKTCSDQQSQVCLFDHRELNYGSSSTPIKIDNDVIKFTIKDGSQCPKNSTLNLKTIFELHCSFKEEHPQLVKENDCDLVVEWKTPEACPKLSTPLGNNDKKFQINRSCTIQDGDKTYDLSALSLNARNHRAKYGDIDFLINICRPIVQTSDTICQNYMGMCSRNNSEPNIKKRFYNLGSVKSPEIHNGSLILQYKNGNFNLKCYKDASAIIYFNCSEKAGKGDPIFVKEEGCRYEFQWDTMYACPNKVSCVKRDNLDNIINFENVKLKSLQFKIDSNVYQIDICKDQFTSNDANSLKVIQEFKVHIEIETNEIGTFLEYKLEKPCQNAMDFNHIKIQLDCDPFINNDHYENYNISNCSIYIKLKHNDFCAFTSTTTTTTTQKTIIYDEKINTDINTNNNKNKESEIFLTTTTTKIIDGDTEDSKNYHYEIDHKNDNNNNNNQKIIDCSIEFNDEEIHLNNLQPLTIKSPYKQFNYVNYTIGSDLTSSCYPHFICKEKNKPLVTLNKCPKVSHEKNGLKLTFNSSQIGGSIFESEIFFYCKTDEENGNLGSLPEVDLEMKDFVSFKYPLKELCSRRGENNGSSSLIIITGIVLCIIIICIGGVLIYNKQFLVKLCSKDKSNTYVYCRNSEL